MRNHGGFEGNAQTLRIVTKLEPYTKGYGMNLTRRTLLGFIKYPALIDTLWYHQPTQTQSRKYILSSDWLPAKGIYQCDQSVFDWILSPFSQNDRIKLQETEVKDTFRRKISLNR